MKVASTADGQEIGFPDEAEDAHMDAAVRAYLEASGKVPPLVDPNQILIENMTQQVTAAIAHQAQVIEQQIALMQHQDAQRAHALQAQIAEMMRQHAEQSINAVLAALTAPKKIKYDSEGRPVGLTVGN